MGKAKTIAFKSFSALILLAAFLIFEKCSVPTEKWSVSKVGEVLEIGYGQGTSYPQYAALHLNDSYFRMNYGPDSGWGTSAVILPSFWSGGVLYQGSPISATYEEVSSDLSVSLTGIISTLTVSAEIRFHPPVADSIAADITVLVSGDAALDDRPGEAFKLAMLSSMHNSPSVWDCNSAFANSETYPIPASGWIIESPALGSVLGLQGGSSAWKANAPTIEVRLDRDAIITGWVTQSVDPNNDNVGFWAAGNELVRFWTYRLIARKVT